MSNFSNLRSQSDKSDQLRLFQVCGVSLHRRGGARALKGLGSDQKIWHKNCCLFARSCFCSKKTAELQSGWLIAGMMSWFASLGLGSQQGTLLTYHALLPVKTPGG